MAGRRTAIVTPGRPDSPRPPRSAPAADRREHLLAAAARSIVKLGAAKVRTRDIAEEAGVGSGVVHYYFESKDDILIEALRWASTLPGQRFTEMRGNGDHLTALAALLEVSLPHPGPLFEEYVLWLNFWTAVAHDRQLIPLCEELASAYRDEWLAVVAEGTEAGAFVPIAGIEDTADRIVAMIDGLAFRTVVGYGWMPMARIRLMLRTFACEQLAVDPGSLPVIALRPAA